LGDEFASVFEKMISHGKASPHASTWILPVSRDEYLPTDKVYAETLYYAVGFLLCAATKEARRRREKMALNLKFLVASASIENDDIDNARTMLPTGKVDRINELGGLRYPTKEFYEVVASLEYMFVNFLTIMSTFSFKAEI
jgi:hypothetical protein